MEEEKRKRLESIKDEVGELHPLLKILLPKMPSVKNVEYTHGNNEMGADFLLSRFDETFGQLDYISVVAKIGKIDQPNISDVDRQIEESFIPKLFNSGKENVNVNEVWVVTNAGVSNGAKIKINDKYRGRKINFITGDKLWKLIDQYAPNFWTAIPLQIGDYLNQFRLRNDEIDRSVSLTKNNADLYVEQDIYTIPENKWEARRDSHKKPHKVDIFQIIQRESAVLIEGEMGAGKSKLLRHIIRHYTHPQHYIDSKIVPIFISYKNLLDNYDGNLNKVLAEYINKGALAEIEKDARFLFLIDGVDEKNLTLEESLKKLSALIAQVGDTPNFKAVITSRELGSVKQNWEILKRSMRLEIHPLSTHRIIEFVQKLCSGANLSKRIFEDLKKSHLFKELPKSPIAAILLANLLQENTKEIPSNMTELYTKYLELVLGRWDIEKGLQTQKEYEALDNVLMRLSKFVVENEIHYMAIDEAKGIVDEYLKPRNLGIETDRLFSILTERTGIIMCDPYEKRICFKHRTFAEYFYAKQKLKDRNLVVDNRAFNVYWLNVFFFFVGQLKDCPDLLDGLSVLEPKSEGERLIKMVNMGNYFMAGFASPYEVVEKGIARVIKDTAIHYSQILNKQIETSLSMFSEMHLFCLFQMILRDSYSYEFFSKAVENAILEIDDCNLDSTTKAYALFFLNVIYIDLEGKESFDLILKKHAKELPLSVQLAIGHESHDLQTKSTLLKRHEKALKKAVRGNKSLQDQLEIMYDRPIRLIKGKIT
ncbi:MAG TPA: NACHT domain-containing protein [Verrucomicrobiae bacterium]|nr:NACHT domain-containing protein [Verrucomicrobiae bacterium]